MTGLGILISEQSWSKKVTFYSAASSNIPHSMITLLVARILTGSSKSCLKVLGLWIYFFFTHLKWSLSSSHSLRQFLISCIAIQWLERKKPSVVYIVLDSVDHFSVIIPKIQNWGTPENFTYCQVVCLNFLFLFIYFLSQAIFYWYFKK